MVFLFAVKPFVDLLQMVTLFDIGGIEVNPSRLFGALYVMFAMFACLVSKARIPLLGLIMLFLGCNLLSSLVGAGEGVVSIAYILNKLLRVAACYFTYLAFARLCLRRVQLVHFAVVSWISILTANCVTLVSWQTGVHHVSISANVERLAGFYNDAGVVSVNALMALIFAAFYYELERRERWAVRPQIRFLVGATTVLSVILLMQSMTKSVLIATVVFSLAWWGVYRRKHLIVIPALVIAPIIMFSESDRMRDRFYNEARVLVDGDYSQAAMGRIASGRVGLWAELLREYRELPLNKQLMGTGYAYGAHNQYLAYLLQLGIVGLTVFLLLTASMIYLVYQRLKYYGEPELFLAIVLMLVFLTLSMTLVPFYNSGCWYAMACLGIALSPQYSFIATPEPHYVAVPA